MKGGRNQKHIHWAWYKIYSVYNSQESMQFTKGEGEGGRESKEVGREQDKEGEEGSKGRYGGQCKLLSEEDKQIHTNSLTLQLHSQTTKHTLISD